jgi:hypothetical protein
VIVVGDKRLVGVGRPDAKASTIVVKASTEHTIGPPGLWMAMAGETHLRATHAGDGLPVAMEQTNVDPYHLQMSCLQVRRASRCPSQTPPDLVVKFQPIDMVNVILRLVLRPRVVYQREITG